MNCYHEEDVSPTRDLLFVAAGGLPLRANGDPSLPLVMTILME